MNDGSWKLWEKALALAICVTMLHTLFFGSTGVAWWGVMFPGLTGGDAAVEATAGVPEGVELRLQILDWLRTLFP